MSLHAGKGKSNQKIFFVEFELFTLFEYYLSEYFSTFNVPTFSVCLIEIVTLSKIPVKLFTLSGFILPSEKEINTIQVS